MTLFKSKQVNLVIQLLLNKDRHNHRYIGCCNQAVNFNTHHILFECTYVDRTRFIAWENVAQNIPSALMKELDNMSNKENVALFKWFKLTVYSRVARTVSQCM